MPMSLPTDRPETAPDWSFYWYSSKARGWIHSQATWKLVVDAYGGTGVKLVEESQLSLFEVTPNKPTFGLMADFQGDTLQVYAGQHGLDWMVKGKTEPDGVVSTL